MKNLFINPSMLRKGNSEEEIIMMTRNIKVVDLNGPKTINKELRNKIVADKDSMNLHGIEFCKMMAKMHNIDSHVEMRIMTKEAIIINEAIKNI